MLRRSPCYPWASRRFRDETARLGDGPDRVTPPGHPVSVTLAPASPRQVPRVTERAGGGGEPDLLDRLRTPAKERPVIGAGLGGGLRAWLEDGVVGMDAGGGSDRPIVVRDGTLLSMGPSARADQRRRTRVCDLRECITRTIFRLTVSDRPPRHPFEDALCAISITERGPDVLQAVGRLEHQERAALREFARGRAETIAANWRRAPSAWLPRTGERLRVPLAGGAVVLATSADLVIGRPSDGTASVLLVRVLEERHDSGGRRRENCGHENASRVRRLLALAETLRSVAPPWRVATYDANGGRLECEDTSERLLVSAVCDVLSVLEVLQRPGRRQHRPTRSEGEEP